MGCGLRPRQIETSGAGGATSGLSKRGCGLGDHGQMTSAWRGVGKEIFAGVLVERPGVFHPRTPGGYLEKAKAGAAVALGGEKPDRGKGFQARL
ncbi:hypothetical protein GCM10011341_16460 [Frigidibacter albus]|nr:hypothetical protein GCM10011341_16460 [Frigidibacter albus]